ncbi:ATP-binding protein [Psychroflexus montanilacus]|uniref:ATP-binding protein n=1 Tax=Psychroflexus montanilacus TaxID=2873598 RepID=UPI001CCCDC14|nr:AAA family ATPase [Psychroflexus montanilacus]MBZ9652582.1 AAA family ATPase [Psychroflexus montanilacus]
MNNIQEKFQRKIQETSLDFIRGQMTDIAWEARLIGIKGARGVGKTTLILQYIKKNLPLNEETLYVSLDQIWFAEHKLIDLADNFVKKGGKYLFLDEVHKYPNWAQELKNIYDDYPQLKIVFTGSSLLEILNARADLSRRAIVYSMQGLSYREYLNLTLKENFPVYKLNDILSDHVKLAQDLNARVKPLQYFQNYLKSGYYPFFQEAPNLYFQRLEEVVSMILEIELPLLRKVDIAYVNKLKQLLHIIAQSVPFMPNISKLSERIGINRNTLISYLYFLQEAQVIRNLYKDAKGITKLQKPDKIFLENTNLYYAFSSNNANIGNLRETFFANQLSNAHLIEYTVQGDFKVAGTYTFEIGGSHKTSQQLKGIENSYVVADNIEYGTGNKIPLWLFGFLY